VVIEHLKAYAWPGNVRELENLVERVSVCCQMPTIEVADLPPTITSTADGALLGVSEDLTPEPFQTAQEIWPSTQEIAEVSVRLPPRAVQPAPEPGRTCTPTPEPHSVPAGHSDVTPTPIQVFGAPSTPNPDLELPVDLPQLLRTLEDSYIRKALNATGGNKKEAAKLLGLGRTTLVEKLRRRGGEASSER
jgi:sigma-54 specific flagellar transcriptional regulator A